MIKWTAAFSTSLIMSFVTWTLFQLVHDHEFSVAFIGGALASLSVVAVFAKL